MSKAVKRLLTIRMSTNYRINPKGVPVFDFVAKIEDSFYKTSPDINYLAGSQKISWLSNRQAFLARQYK